MPGVKVTVKTQYLAEHSTPDASRFAFAYTITITNNGDAPVQLLRRHWIITDGNRKTQEVRGDGVVGVQPLIAPGQSHTYTSGAVLETPIGTMEGSYQMQTESGDLFDALIPRFSLAKPGALH
ncbi:MAG TPA: Co2+/Mg2+ efflux protein ApaG [Pseudomonadales bacterium]|nr:Co2+/Mg2+ efflux protein ApaG [Pseudomonadales bacterium]